MKIRKTAIQQTQIDIFIYENKKEEYIVMAIPALEWSARFSYDETGEDLKERLTHSLEKYSLAEGEASGLAERLSQWAREM